MSQHSKMPFTGRHISAVLIAFFGTIIAVNILMAVLAIGTFGGVVVDNSYVASQRFNGWLKQARAQDALGWREEIGLDAERRIVFRLSDTGAANGHQLMPATVEALARHPLGRAPEQLIRFTQVAPGQYRAIAPLPRGRWLVHFTLASGIHEKRLIKELQ